MVMKCHYEVLGVARDADGDAIKQSYRKLALKFHPDKNLENIEEATLAFRVVQQAYDVLSDPQERAWYDKHREAILMGGMGKGDEYEDKSLDVYAYFNSSCYSGFHDDQGGFYAVYRAVFQQIAEEDSAYVNGDDSDYELPGFGDSLSSYDETVGPFYGYWEAYCTTKSYVWYEKWDTRDAPDRMTRRAMEQENKKMCEAKRKERNEEVRALVAFVKKRDRRVIARKRDLAEKAERAAKFAVERRLNARKEQLRRLENYAEVDWSSMSQHEDQLKTLENELAQEFRDPDSCSSDNSEEITDSLFCVVCNKSFKTDRAMINHEKSKKHKDNVAALRDEMLADDEEFNLELSDNQETQASVATPQKLSKKQKKRRKQQQMTQLSTSTTAGPDPADPDPGYPNDADPDTERTDTNTAAAAAEGLEMLHERLDGLKLDGDKQQEDLLQPDLQQNGELIEVEEDDSFVHKSVNKSKKKGKKKSQASSAGAAVNTVVSDGEPGSSLMCKVCKLTVTSRNKLFEHIKESGHAAFKPLTSQSTINSALPGDSKAKRKGKRK